MLNFKKNVRHNSQQRDKDFTVTMFNTTLQNLLNPSLNMFAKTASNVTSILTVCSTPCYRTC